MAYAQEEEEGEKIESEVLRKQIAECIAYSAKKARFYLLTVIVLWILVTGLIFTPPAVVSKPIDFTTIKGAMLNDKLAYLFFSSFLEPRDQPRSFFTEMLYDKLMREMIPLQEAIDKAISQTDFSSLNLKTDIFTYINHKGAVIGFFVSKEQKAEIEMAAKVHRPHKHL